MKVEIKDKEKLINTALRSAGFQIDNVSTELILNIIDYVRQKPDATIKEIVEITSLVEDLYKD